MGKTGICQQCRKNTQNCLPMKPECVIRWYSHGSQKGIVRQFSCRTLIPWYCVQNGYWRSSAMYGNVCRRSNESLLMAEPTHWRKFLKKIIELCVRLVWIVSIPGTNPVPTKYCSSSAKAQHRKNRSLAVGKYGMQALNFPFTLCLG